MITIGIARIGNEPVVRFTPDNTPVLDLSLAYDYGRKGKDGKRPTQWINAAMFGDRCEKLVPYLKKGNQICVHLTDLHIETYTKKDGTIGSSIKARVSDLQLISAPQQEPASQPAVKPAAQSFEEMDDDLPF